MSVDPDIVGDVDAFADRALERIRWRRARAQAQRLLCPTSGGRIAVRESDGPDVACAECGFFIGHEGGAVRRHNYHGRELRPGEDP